MTEKKAILAASFGTSYEETRDKTIGAIERDLAAAYPGWEVRRAFTSGMILRVIKNRDGLHIDTVAEALQRLLDDGFTRVVIQPTHIINGEEYEKLCRQAEAFQEAFAELKIGQPLISSSQDFDSVTEAVVKHIPELAPQPAAQTGGPAAVLMGHGTGHHTDAVYAALDYRFKARGYSNVVVGTVEGYPELSQVQEQLERLRPSNVILMPFMVVAGDHAVNDLAGDEEDSWKSVLEAQGYRTEARLEGLGEFKEIRDIYIAHAAEAMRQKEK